MANAPLPPLPTLPMQLTLALGCWLNTDFALRCAKSASTPSNSALKKALESAGASPAKRLKNALAEEGKSRAASLLSGILRYLDASPVRAPAEPPVIWRKGNARLLNYGRLSPGGAESGDSPLVLFIPSLINRYYILDLEEERSLLRFLARQGLFPLALDWGQPGERERGFDCAAYVTEILLPAIDFIAAAAGKRRIVLAGYCMGGVLAMAAAQLRRDALAGLALLAAPWNFHCREFASFILDPKWRPALEEIIGNRALLPADIVQALFYAMDPWVFEQKFRRFAQMPPGSRAAGEFVALERWVNDGVPMTAAVAKDCLLGWAQDNALAREQWIVGGKPVSPRRLRLPSFIAIPRSDHVVPRGCAEPLAAALPDAKLIYPAAGHVSMIVGGNAPREVWQPFAQWIKAGYA